MQTDEHQTKANQLVEAQQYDDAIKKYRLSLESNADKTWLLNDIAWCYYCLEKYDQALSTCNQALSSDMEPEYKSIALLWKGKILEKQGLVNEALESFDSGLSFASYSVNLLWAKGKVLATLNRPDEAIVMLKLCRSAIERDAANDGDGAGDDDDDAIQSRAVERCALLESIETDITCAINAAR